MKIAFLRATLGRKLFFIFCLLTGPALSAHASDRMADQSYGMPQVQTFAVEDFQGAATNWFVQQNDQGIIFLSNGNGLFSFDGLHWRQLMAAQNIRQFVLAADGRIYIAAESELGYLQAQANGEYDYHSLLDALPKTDRAISDVNNVYWFEGRVYFFAPEQIMVYQTDTPLRVIKPEFRFSRAWITPDKLFFSDGRELRYFANADIHRIGALNEQGISGFGFVQKIADQAYVIGTFSKGIYLWQHGHISTLVSADDALAGKGYFNSLRINDDVFAVATIRDGVYFFNHQAKVLYHLDNHNGLPVNITLNLYLDAEQGLWLAQEGQLVRAQLPFDLSLFPGSVYNIAKVKRFARFDDKLYLAAVNGVRAIDRSGNMTLVPDVTNSAAVVVRWQDRLLIGGASRCVSYAPQSGQITRLLRAASCKDIFITGNARQDIFLLTERGIWLTRKQAQGWKEAELIEPNHLINSLLVQDSRGDVWTSTSEGQLMRLHDAGDRWQLQKMTVASDDITVLERNGHILVATDQGLFHWDDNTQQLGQRVAWFDRFFGANAPTPSFLFEDDRQRLWINNGEKSGYLALQQGQPVAWHDYPVAASGLHQLRQVYQQGEVSWLGFDDGIVRYVARVQQEKTSAQLLITQLRDARSGAILQQTPGTPAIEQIRAQQAGQPLVIEFTLTAYLQNSKNRYRYRLDDQAWSAWDDRASVTVNAPYGGDFNLQLQAHDFRGQRFTHVPVHVSIAAPWFATPLAMMVYGLLLLSLFWLMANRFAAYKTRQLKQQQALLEQQVQQRTATIALQAQQLKRLDAAKSRFFANVSHEFRTPLTLAIGPLEALSRDDEIQSPTARQHIRVALENSRRMLSLVGQILDINRLEHGEMSLAVTRVDLTSALQKIIDQFALVAEQNDLSIRLSAEPALAIYFDEDHLYKIFSNLLSNAVKFSPDHGCIEIEVQETASQQLEISISDEGPGIPDDERKQLFQRFFQGKNSSNNLQPGTGIGLAMVKELLALHQGTITLDADDRQGCRFRVTLCRGKAHYVDADLLDASLQTDKINTFAPPADSIEPVTELAALSVSTQMSQHVPTVLVIDDNRDLRAFIQTTLSSAYHCVEAENGVLALKLLDRLTPDFIICDVMMPHMDGIEFTRRVKENSATAHIPMLLLTAKVTKRDTVHGLQQGADDYLAKPFDSSELIARIAAHLQQKKHISQAIYQSFVEALPAPANDTDATSFKARFEQLVRENLADAGFDIAAMSKAMNMERSTLFRHVKKTFDCTPNQYLKSQRLKMALQMLRKNSGSISEIAYAVGFQSLNYFSRSFRDQYQVSPSAHHKISQIA